jgi:hypothetical protein
VGIQRGMDSGCGHAWGVARDKPALGGMKPFDGKVASAGHWTMVAIVVDRRHKVDRQYRQSLEFGSKDEGAAGPRGDGFYAGYLRDRDGNKLNAFCVA